MSMLEIIPVPEWSPEGLVDYFHQHQPYFVVLSLIFLNALGIVYFVISIVFKQRIKRRQEARRLILQTETEDLLSAFLADNGSEELAASILRGWSTKSRENERTICEVFVEFFGMIGGSARPNLYRLYDKSGIKNLVVLRLNRTGAGYHIPLYIDLASQSQTTEARQGLKNLLKHPEREIRFQALCALVEVFRFNALSYIAEVGAEINEWEEMILMEKLLKLPGRGEIPMHDYLHSDNDSLMRLILRMARHFNRYDVEEELPALLRHPSATVRSRVYELSGPLLLNGLQPYFIGRYPTETKENQALVLKSLARMGDGEALPFLIGVMQSVVPELSLLAASAIHAIAGSDTLREAAGMHPDLLRMCHHIEDPLLA